MTTNLSNDLHLTPKTFFALPQRVVGLCALIVAMTAPTLAQRAALANHATEASASAPLSTEALPSGELVRMKGSVHPLTRRAVDLGAVDSAIQMDSLTLNVGLKASAQAELQELVAAQQDPGSPLYHRWLTQEEYGARFGLTDTDLAAVTAWLERQGLTVRGVSKSRNALYFSGRVWQVEAAFHTRMHWYGWPGATRLETHFANASELQFPEGLAQVVQTVRGLNDFRLKPRLRKASAAYTVGTAMGLTNFLTPADWATIYNVNAIYDAGYTGAGAYVGVVGQTYAPETDIVNFRSAAGLPSLQPVGTPGAAALVYSCIDPVSANCTGAAATSTVGDLGEADLDLQWAGGVARDATVVYVYAPYEDSNRIDPTTAHYYGVFDALQRAVQDYVVPATGKVLPVISMSYTDCEASFGAQPGELSMMTAIGLQANAQGQTLVVASGDTGAAGCDYQSDYAANQGESASVPGDSPNYTGVGGTTLIGDESNVSAYWSQALNVVSSALQYVPETTWNDSAANGGLATSGGGVSVYFAQPNWQPTPANYAGAAGRMVPDVAFAASPDHDGYMTCSPDGDSVTTGTDCMNGFASNNGYYDVVGGTSAGAPSFAGMMTLLVQKYGPQGNVNPTLYGIARETVFHDITTGSNVVPCVVETLDPGCAGGVMGYAATTGYDLATGLGSIDGGALYAALSSAIAPVSPPVVTTPTPPPAATVLTVSAATGSVALNGTTALTATVASASAGSITGTVTFAVGSVSLGSAALAGGMARLSKVAVTEANGFSAGSDAISASYSGDGNFAASRGSTMLTVTAAAGEPAVAAYTLSALANSVSMTAGDTANVSLELLSTNYTGTVSLTAVCNSAAIATNAPADAPLTVGLRSGGNGSSTLTITASPSANRRSPGRSGPWTGGGVMVCGVLLAAPVWLRGKRSLAVLASALMITTGLLVSCGGGAGAKASVATQAAQSFLVTVTAVGTPSVANPAPVSVTVNIQ